MTGETDLDTLLASMRATLIDGIYVFATLKEQPLPTGITARMVFHEAEGTTIILLKSEAEAAGIPYDFPCRMITLNVHSSLEAVGFIARIATDLAAAGMGVNPVSGYYHDHLFIPADRADEAMEILVGMANQQR